MARAEAETLAARAMPPDAGSDRAARADSEGFAVAAGVAGDRAATAHQELVLVAHPAPAFGAIPGDPGVVGQVQDSGSFAEGPRIRERAAGGAWPPAVSGPVAAVAAGVKIPRGLRGWSRALPIDQ